MLDTQQISDREICDRADRSSKAVEERYKVHALRLQAQDETGHPHGQLPSMDKDRRDQSLAR